MSEKLSSDRGRRTSPVLSVAAIVVGIGAGIAVYVWQADPMTPSAEVHVVTQPEATAVEQPTERPAFELLDLDGVPRHVSVWDGHLLVLNFWATWCGPCRHEIPYFVQLQKKFGADGLQVVGIAIDTPANVAPFYAQMQMNYPTLLGQADAIRVGEAYGNRIGGLPYTVFIDRDGRIVRVKNGPMELDELTAIIKQLL
jgi:thiol-disulfide isomerase/thioredoxin